MEPFRFNKAHIIERLKQRYKKRHEEAQAILDRVQASLVEHTPADWRFTDSPASRFFVLEETTGAKFLGVSYRFSTEGEAVLARIREQSDKPQDLARALDRFVQAYISEIQRDDLKVVHHIRTVYGRGPQAHIAEERTFIEQSRDAVGHVLALYAKKIAARPNAAVLSDGSLWVRQYHNWVSQDANASEFYLFQPLTKKGVDKMLFRVYKHAHNGSFKLEDECRVCDNVQCRPSFRLWNRPDSLRTESYWKLPTVIDLRLADLDFCERYAAKGAPFDARDLLELYWLRRLIETARETLYRKR